MTVCSNFKRIRIGVVLRRQPHQQDLRRKTVTASKTAQHISKKTPMRTKKIEEIIKMDQQKKKKTVNNHKFSDCTSDLVLTYAE